MHHNIIVTHTIRNQNNNIKIRSITCQQIKNEFNMHQACTLHTLLLACYTLKQIQTRQNTTPHATHSAQITTQHNTTWYDTTWYNITHHDTTNPPTQLTSTSHPSFLLLYIYDIMTPSSHSTPRSRCKPCFCGSSWAEQSWAPAVVSHSQVITPPAPPDSPPHHRTSSCDGDLSYPHLWEGHRSQ